jgi:peptidoglycan L-alanyl-D-glutamate endopeptidase CwlK
MDGVHGDLVLVFSEAIKYSPIDFGVPSAGGMRTKDQQKALFDDGKSKCDGIKTLSKHQRGEALDFFAFVNGKASWDKVHLSLVAAVILSTAKRLKSEGVIYSDFRWGGTFGSKEFKGWDMPHIEIKR